VPIALDKVLIVYNLDDTSGVSLSVASYYIAKRGLNINHALGFHWGAVSPVGQLQTLDAVTHYPDIVRVADYMIANNIEAVLASANVPILISLKDYDNPANNAWDVSFENVLGTAKYWKKLGRLNRSRILANNPYNGEKYFYGDYTGRSGISLTVNKSPTLISNIGSLAMSDSASMPDTSQRHFKKTHHFQSNTDWVPHGRIGRGYVDSVPRSETFSESISFVDKAVVQEQSVTSAKALQLPIHCAFASVGDTVDISYGQGWLTRNLLLSLGLKCVAYQNTGVASPNPAWRALVNPITDYDDTIIFTAQPPIWGQLGFMAMTAAATKLPGAWGCGGASYGLLNNGAINLGTSELVAYTGSLNEPWSDTLMEPESFLRSLTQGLSMMEAASFNRMVGGWMVTTWGDPLYRPFGKTNITLVG
jgi:hypothetical protein